MGNRPDPTRIDPSTFRCPLCGDTMSCKPSKYGHFFSCDSWSRTKCDVIVGCHPKTKIPLGYPATKEVRQLRHRCHELFDPIWRNGKMNRKEAYRWLSLMMNIQGEAHIGEFNKEQCEQLIKILEETKQLTV